MVLFSTSYVNSSNDLELFQDTHVIIFFISQPLPNGIILSLIYLGKSVKLFNNIL